MAHWQGWVEFSWSSSPILLGFLRNVDTFPPWHISLLLRPAIINPYRFYGTARGDRGDRLKVSDSLCERSGTSTGLGQPCALPCLQTGQEFHHSCFQMSSPLLSLDPISAQNWPCIWAWRGSNFHWFEVGVRWGREFHGFIEFFRINILDVNEIHLILCIVVLDGNVDEFQV